MSDYGLIPLLSIDASSSLHQIVKDQELAITANVK